MVSSHSQTAALEMQNHSSCSTGKRMASPTMLSKKKVHVEQTTEAALHQQHAMIFGFLNPVELLHAALVSKTWCTAADQASEQLLSETETKHSVSVDWRQRLTQHLKEKQQGNLSEDEPPSRCLWKVAQILDLNQFELPPEDTDFFIPHAVGLPTAMGPGAFAMVRPDGFLRILDTKSCQWTQWDVVTGQKWPNYDIQNEEEGDQMGRWHCGSLLVCGDYLIYWNGLTDHYFTVWRLLPNEEPQFLHHTKLPVRRTFDVPDYVQGYAVDVDVRDGVLVANYVFEVEMGDLQSLDDKDTYARDDHSLNESLAARFGLNKELTILHEVLAYDSFDLETGRALAFQITRPIKYRQTLDYEGSGTLSSNEAKLWVGARYEPTAPVCVHEVDKLALGQPLVRTLRTGIMALALQGIYPSNDELIAYLERPMELRCLQTYFL